MASRLNLQYMLENIIGSTNVYYQPPGSADPNMQYPAIVYSRGDISNLLANNAVYKQNLAYLITVIDEDPDSKIVEAISKLPQCKFNRHFTSEGLNHDVFKIYF